MKISGYRSDHGMIGIETIAAASALACLIRDRCLKFFVVDDDKEFYRLPTATIEELIEASDDLEEIAILEDCKNMSIFGFVIVAAPEDQSFEKRKPLIAVGNILEI